MSWVDDTITAFGRSIGILELSLDENSRIDFAFEGGALAGIRHLTDRAEPELLLYRSRPFGFDLAPRARAALRLADFRHSRPWPAQAAVHDDQLVLAIRIPQRAFTLDALESAFSELGRLHAELADTD